MRDAFRLTLRIAGIAGSVLFGTLFVLTFTAPDSVERVAQAFIKYQVEKEIRQKHATLSSSSYGKALLRLKAKYEAQAREYQAALNENLALRIAGVVAAMCRLDCKQ